MPHGSYYTESYFDLQASAAMAEDAAAAASTAAVVRCLPNLREPTAVLTSPFFLSAKPPAKKSKSDFADLRLSPDSPVPVETLLARGELSLESLNEGDELYLVQVPVDASNKTLEGLEVDLSRNVSRVRVHERERRVCHRNGLPLSFFAVSGIKARRFIVQHSKSGEFIHLAFFFFLSHCY